MTHAATGSPGAPSVDVASPLARIAVLGAGHSGPVIARVAIDAGYPVSIASSGHPGRIALIAQVLIPGAKPRWAAAAVADADIVVLAIPIHRFAAFDPALVAGKIVVDVMNYWPPVDGVQELFEDRRTGSSEIVQDRLARSTVVKTLNHIGYHEIDEERRPGGSPDRRALGVAGDDPAAVDAVASIIERIGYDPSGWTASAPAASSSPAARSSARRWDEPSSSGPSGPKPHREET
jgi:predicted dinucleotide-binding enzyme